MRDDAREYYASLWCPDCWRPGFLTPGCTLIGMAETEADARADWNRQCAFFWGSVLGGPMRNAERA